MPAFAQQVLAVVQEALVLEERRAVDLALVGGARRPGRGRTCSSSSAAVVRQRRASWCAPNWAGQITSPMKTSGEVEPPEIWVVSVARLVSVSVGAGDQGDLDVRVLLLERVDQHRAGVVRARAGQRAGRPDDAARGSREAVAGADALPPLLLPPLLHADTASTATPATAASARPPLRWSPLLGALLRDISAPPGVARPRGRSMMPQCPGGGDATGLHRASVRTRLRGR